jgi:hypothetical protein
MIILLLMALCSWACGSTAKTSDRTANENQPAAPSRSEAGPTTEPDPQKAWSQLELLPNLRGIYTMSEIEYNGAVTLVPPAFATTFTFMEDGFYNRKSMRPEGEFSSGSGYYRIERSQEGQLTLVLDQKFIGPNKSPSKEKRQVLTLSPEGDILRLTGTDGKIAVFRRTGFSQPKTM